MAITSTLRRLNVLGIYKTSLNIQIYFSSHPPKSLLCKVIGPQTHMLCVGKINVCDWQQFRTPANRNLCRIWSSQSWGRVNVQGKEYCGWLFILFRILRICMFQAIPYITHCRRCMGLHPSGVSHLECLPTSSPGTVRISENLKGSFSPLLKFAVCHKPNGHFR